MAFMTQSKETCALRMKASRDDAAAATAATEVLL
jgi:hypothetical protein